MRFLNWLNRHLGKSEHSPNLHFDSFREDSNADLELVRLEDRIVLSVSVGLGGVSGDVLEINLDAPADEATVSVIDSGATIQVEDLTLPGSIMQLDASQVSSVLVTGTDASQIVNFLGQENLVLPGDMDLTAFTGDVNIGIQIQVGSSGAPQFNLASTVSYLGQFQLSSDELNVVLPNELNASETFTIQINGPNLEIIDPGSTTPLLFSTPVAGLNSINVIGADGESDHLTLDYSSPGLTDIAISFDGGSGGNDVLEFIGGTFDTVTHDLTGPGTGMVDLVDNGITEISYTGLEPVFGGSSTADNIVINLPTATFDAVLEDSIVPGEMQIRSLSAAFEMTTFASPTDSLTINTAGGNSVVAFNSFDTTFAPSDLIISGTTGDNFLLTGNDLLSDSVSLTLSGGATLDMSTFNETVDGFILEDGNVIATSGILSAQSNFDLRSGSVNAQLNGTDLVKNGMGTVILDAANAYTGQTIINDGILQLAQSFAVPNTSNVDLTSVTSVLDLNGFEISLTSLTGSGDVQLGGPAGVLNINQATATSSTFAGSITGDGNLNKLGEGEFVLSGTNSITGSTDIQNGLFRVEGDLTTSDLIVASGATLGGAGSITAPVSVSPGGRLAPGSSPGITSTGDLTLNAGSTLDIEIDGTNAGTEYDQVLVTGTVDVTGATLNLISTFTASAADEFILINNDDSDAVTGTFTGLAEGALLSFNGNQVYISYVGGDGNDVVLTVNSPPASSDQIFDIDENSINTTPVGTIVATDTDVPPDSLTFGLTGGTGQTAFNVSASGEITVADQNQLDYESSTSLDLEILVTDSAGETDTATITINLNPLNDNSPVVADQIRSINENSMNGTNVGAIIVSADDDLPGDSLTFSEAGGTGAAAFNITSGGQIVVADQSLLDYEINPTFTLDVIVDDNAGSTDTATITINLNPLNDNSPVVADQIRSIDENATNGTNVGALIVATDDDQPGDTLTFSETGGTGATAFDITSGGQIVVADQSLLNFETNPSYTLDIEVNDGAGGITAATITINLNDLSETLYVNPGDWSVNDITLVRDGSQLRVLETGTMNEIVSSHNFASISNVIITGNGSNNVTRIELSSADITTAGGINFNGGAGTNTIVAPNQTNDWNITGVNSGSLLSGSVTFSNVENLTGNNGNDTYVMQDAGQIDGTIDGGLGFNTIDFSADSDVVTINYTTASATTVNIGIGIDKIIGDNSQDRFIGGSVSAIYVINGVNKGVVDGFLEFEGFSHLTGAAGADQFQFTGAGQITGSIDGLSGVDVLDYSASSFALDVMLTATGSVDGFAGNETSTLTSFDNINTLIGSSNTDSLTGINATADWSIDGTNQYTSTNTLDFSAFENLIGGTDVDTFTITGSQANNLAGNSGNDIFRFQDGASLTGDIDGQSGSDTLDYNLFTNSIDAVLTDNGSIDGFKGTEASISNGFDNINRIEAGSGAADKLTGRDAAATWTLQPSSMYASVTSLGFQNFETLQGGNDVDTFNINGTHSLDLLGGLDNDIFQFTGAGQITGSIGGQAGVDVLDYSASSVALDLMLTANGSSNGFSGSEASTLSSFDNINTLIGSGNTDSLTGIDATADWSIDGTNQYISTNTLDFSAFENLIGGTDVDTFTITGSQTNNLAGNSGNDIFRFQDGASLTGNIDGQSGSDTLDYNLFTSSIDAVLTDNGSIDGFQGTEASISNGFDNINRIEAGSGAADKLTGRDAAATWTLQPSSIYGSVTSLGFQNFETLQGGNEVDTFNINGAHTLDLLGGSGNDIFLFDNDGSTLTGTIDGQGESDHLNFTNYTTSLTTTLTGIGGTDGFDGNESAKSINFQNIDQLTGGSGTNSLTGINSAANWTLNGTNTYQSTNSLEFSNFVNLTGGTDTDIFNLTPNTEAFSIAGGDPTSNPMGDQLNIDTSAAGTALVSSNGDGSGSVTGAFPTVTYSEIEDFAITGVVDVQIDGTTNNDVIEILVVGPNVEYRMGGIIIGSSLLSDTNHITVNGGDGDDSLTVDAALAAEGITIDYDGEGQVTTNPGDVLNLIGTSTSVEYFFADITSGSVRIDGALTDFIVYTGLEPITSSMTASDITLNYSAVTETITITDAGGGETTVNSTAGELLTFANPTNSLTINTGDGADIVNIDSLAANFTASLTINGEADTDTINANATVSLDTGKNIVFNAENINVANGVTITADAIALNATDINLDGDLVSANVSGDATTVNVPGSVGGADLQDAVDVAGTGGMINVSAGNYQVADSLRVDESVSILGAGKDVVQIRKAGAPTGSYDIAIDITANNVTVSGAQIGWQTHTAATDYRGYVIYTTADNTTLNNLLFSDNYRSAVVFEGANNLEVSDSIFEGKLGRAAIRDGDGGSGENFLITRNEFREDHFRWGPIAIGPQGTFSSPNNFAFSGEISFNYFGNGLVTGDFQEAGDQNYSVTITNRGMTTDGIDIFHNSFDWQDSSVTNGDGNFAQPGGIYFDPSLSVPIGTVNITDNIFNGFTYDGPQPTAPSIFPLWRPAGGQFAGALEFDGQDDFGTFQSPLFDVGTAGTLNLWVNMHDQGQRAQFFEGLQSKGFEFQYRENGGGQFFGSPGRDGNSNNYAIQSGGASGTENIWQNLQYTWDFNAVGGPQMHIYVDGVEVAYLSSTFDSDLSQWVNTVSSVNQLITVGKDASSGKYFDGLMDDVGWFDAALSDPERDNIRINGVAALSGHANLIAHWDFDQSAGNTVIDNKNGIEITLTTGVVPPQFVGGGQFGGALQFDGTEDFATFQDASFDVGKKGTLNFWVKMEDTGRRNQFFEGPDDGGLEFQYRTNSGGQFFGRTQDSADYTIQSGGHAGVETVWTNLQYTWDADTGEMHIYLNGVEEPYLSSYDENLAGFDSTHFTDTVNGLMDVGRDPSRSDRFFEGLMDDIGWYNEVLDQTDRDAIRATGVTADPRLVAHWNLDDAPGTTIAPGDSGTNIDLYIQAEPPLPPIQGFGVIAPLNANVTYNAFNNNDLDSNVTLDTTNQMGDPLYAYANDPLYTNTPSLETQFTIGFGSSAAYFSSEFAGDTNTTLPHIGAYQNPPTLYPGLFGQGDIEIFGTGEDDLLELTLTGEDTATFVLTRDVGGTNEVLGTVLLTDITSITFNGLGGDDVLILNQPDNQFFNPSGGVIFNGGTQNNDGNTSNPIGANGDTLVINHATPIEADSVAYVFTPDAVPAEGEDGVITITDATISDGSTTITFTGLEPILDNLSAADRSFEFTDAAESISLIDDASPNDNYSFIDSSLSESVLFLNPTSSITIRTDTGTPGIDTITIDTLDSLFDASLSIHADNDDSVTFQSTTNLVTGDLFVTASTVDILSDINAASVDISSSGVTSTTFNGGTVTTTGSQLYNNAVNFVTNSTLTSSGGANIEFASLVDGAIDLNVNTAGTTIFGGAVGSNTALTSLTTDADGTTNINGGIVNTTANQLYNDDVVLGANTTLTSTDPGNITFDKTLNGAFTLDVNTAGITNFNGNVGNSAALTSLTTDADGTTNINGGIVNTTANQLYYDDVQIGANTTLTSTDPGNITFDKTLNGAFTLDVNTAGITNFNGTVGNSAALTSLTTDADGTTNINGGIVNTTANQLYNDDVVLGANTTLTSTDPGNITFNKTLNGAFTLDVNTAGITNFNGTVGNSAALTSLTTDADGTTNINGGIVNTTANQLYNDDVVLGANATLTSTDPGNITFNKTLNGAFTLDVNTAGITNFIGTVGNSAALTSLTTDADGTTNINGGIVNTTANQLYNDDVVLGANTTLSSTDPGNITFNKTLNGAFTLDVNTAGITNFNGTVGNSAALTSLTTDADGTTNINGGIVNTTANQLYNDDVVLGANATLTSTDPGNITFNKTLNGAFTLDVNTAGITNFNGTVGNSAALTSLTTDADGTTNINGGIVNTTANQLYNDDVVLGANATLTSTDPGNITFNKTLNGAFTLDVNTAGITNFNGTVGNSAALTSLTTDADGTTNINGGIVNTTANQLYNDDAVLGANTTLTSTDPGNITFNKTLNGAFTLDVNTAGITNFNGTVGNSTALTSLTTDADGTTNINGGIVNTTANQLYNDDVVLGANTTLTSTDPGNITFDKTLNGAFTLDVNTAGITNFNGNVGNSAALTSLTTDADGTTNINGGIVNTTANQLYNDDVVLGANTTLTSTDPGNITFNKTLNGAFTLDVNTAGITNFNGTVGNSAALTSLTTDADGTTNINGGIVNTTANQLYNDDVVLGANTTLTSTDPGNITFDKTLNGAFTLDVNTAGITNFNGTVGNSAALTSLTTDADGTTNINGGIVNTTANQLYNDDVVLGANTTLTSTDPGNVTFNKTLNGAFTLDVNTAGITNFNGTVGNSAALTSLTTDTDGTTNINGGIVNTTANQLYNDDVVLGANTTLTSTDPGNITFNKTLNGAFTLDVNTAGITNFNGNVGNSAALTSLTTDADGTTNINGGIVNTTANQLYNDDAVLGANTTLTSTDPGNITFNKTLNGAFTLDVNTAGITNFNGNVGNSTALTSLTTDADGTTNINGGIVNTTANQLYNDDVVLGANTTLTSTDPGNITFTKTLNGAFSLDVNTAGITNFNGTVGNSIRLTSLTTNALGTTNVNGGTVDTTGAQTYHDAVALGISTTFSSHNTDDITFNSTLTGGGAINIDIISTNNIILNGVTSTDGNFTANADSPLSGTGDFTMQVGSSLDAGSGTIDIDGANVTTRSVTTTNTSASSVTIDATNGNVITKDNGVNSRGDITINATGTVTLEDQGVNTGDGGGVVIQANGDITSTGTGIDTTLGTAASGSIEITSNTGKVEFSNGSVLTGDAGNIKVDAVTGFTALNSIFNTTAGTGSGSVEINVSAGSNSITTGGVTVNGTGTILLTAKGATSDILVSSELTSVDGSISLLADNDITLSSTTKIISQASGSIILTADNDGSSAGSITMDSGSVVESLTGQIQLSAYDNVAVSAIKTGTRVDITSTNGNITDNDVTVAKNVTANQLVMNSNTGIGDIADAIDTAVSFLEADAGTGGFYLDNMGNLTVGGIEPLQVGIDAELEILVNVMGTLDITENVQSTMGESVTFNATDELIVNVGTTIATVGSGAILLTTPRNIKLNSGSNLKTVNGGISLQANNTGTTTGDFIGVEANNATIETTGTGAILITGFGGDDVSTNNHHGVHIHTGTTVKSTSTGASAGTITINGTGGSGLTDNAGVRIESASTSVSSVDGNIQITGIATTGDGIQIANQGVVLSTGVGANAATITIDGTTASNNAGITISSNVQSTDGTINLTGISNGAGANSNGVQIQTVAGQVTSVNGDITIDGTSNGNDGVQISDSASINETGTGNLVLLGNSTETGSGINHNAIINSNTGTVTFTSEDDIVFGSVALIDSTSGTIAITADNAAGNNGNPISMSDGALIDAGTGDINLNTDGNILLGGLLTTGTVTIDSTSASIIDNGNSHTDITASIAILNAATGIGDGNPLETDISTLTAKVSGVGNLHIDNGIDVELLDVSTFDGNIIFNATATITATSVVSTNNSTSETNDISLTATGTNSDILVTTITATGIADVTLTADDGIFDTDDGDTNRITADNLMMTSSSTGVAPDGINVQTDVNSVTAAVDTNPGGLRILEVDDIILTQLTTLDGFITVNAGGTIQAINVTSENNSSSDTLNGISLTATGATSDILITTIDAKNTADITLNSERNILDSDSTDMNITFGDHFTAVAGGNIGGITSIFTETGYDPLQTTVDHLDLTSGNIITIHNTGTSPELINLDAGTGTPGTTFIRVTGGSLDVSLTTGISNLQDNIGLVSDTSITVPTGLQTANLRLDAPDIIDAGGGNIDINAVNAILFNSTSAETVEITAQQFDGTTTGSDFVIINDSPALELVDLNTDSQALTGGTGTNVSLTSVGTVTVSNLVSTAGTGTLLIDVTDTNGDLVLNQNIQSATGSVTIKTADNIIFNGSNNLTSTSGTVMLTADSDNAAGATSNGGITMADSSFINAGDGATTLKATDDITLSQIITTNATNSAIHLETSSSVIDSGDSTGEDLIANEAGALVTIVSVTGVGKVADPNGAIETHVDQINITNQTSGEIQITETDAIIVHDLIQTTIGNINVTTGGNILLSGLVQTIPGDVVLDTQAAIIDQNDSLPSPLNIHALNLDLNAITGIGIGDTLELSVDNLSADTTNGDILLHNTATNSVVATSITTGTGNIEFEQIGNESLTFDLVSTNDGNITISNEGDAQSDTLTLTSVTAGGTTPVINVSTIGFGNILLGDVTGLEGLISVTSAGNINDAVDDQVLPEVDVNAASGSITFQALNGIGNNDIVELSAGNLTINTTTGDIDVNNLSSSATGAVTVDQLTTGLGTINYIQTGGQSTNFEEISTTDSAITILADGSMTFENLGVLTNVVSTDGTGTIEVTATGVNSSIQINDGFQTVGGTINLTAENSLAFGTEGDISTANGVLTLRADSASRGAGGGGITMSDGTVFNAGSGTVDLQAGDNIAVGQLFTTTLTRLTSTAGGVTDSGDTGGRDITTEELAIRTATGIGSANPIETAVSLLAATNSTSGNILIHNDLSGALITISTVDGIAGVTHSGSSAGDIFISNASPLTVNAAVTNGSGGNIHLESTGPGDLIVNAPIRALGGDGNINLEAGDGILDLNDTGNFSDHSLMGTGVFSGHGTNGVTFDSSMTLHSETGAIADIPPDLRNVLTPQIEATGKATVTGDFGRLTEQNFFITIDWGDGTVETTNFTNPGSFTFTHTYIANPNTGNPAAPIPIIVTMQGDMQFTFSDGTGNLDFTTQTGFLETPGDGLATVAIDTTPQVPLLLFPPSQDILDSTSNQSSVITSKDTVSIESSINEANKNADRLVFLRILAPNGNVIEDVTIKESDLDNLPKLFKSLPDGRYQLYLKEAGEERIRLLMDVDIRGGKATDVTEAQTSPANNQPAEPDNNTTQKESEATALQVTAIADTHTESPLLSTVFSTEADQTSVQNDYLSLEWVKLDHKLNDLQLNQNVFEAKANLETSELNKTQDIATEEVWSSAALLSGYFHGKSLLKKSAKQDDFENAMGKYGRRLFNRHYNIFKRNQ